MSNSNVQRRCDAKKLKVGSRLSRASYMEIVAILPDNTFRVRNEEGKEWKIGGDILEDECYAADQYTDEQKVTHTELSHLLHNVGDTIVTVHFEKKVTEKQVADNLKEVQENEPDAFAKPAKRRKLAKMLLTGADRQMVCHLKHNSEGKAQEKMGRSVVYDLEVQAGDNERQVDHRTLHSIIFKNKRYVLK